MARVTYLMHRRIQRDSARLWAGGEKHGGATATLGADMPRKPPRDPRESPSAPARAEGTFFYFDASPAFASGVALSGSGNVAPSMPPSYSGSGAHNPAWLTMLQLHVALWQTQT
jgi:hypothetical protein